MSGARSSRRERTDQAIDDLTARMSRAISLFCSTSTPRWKRTTQAMLCFKGLALSDLPPKLKRRVNSSFARINGVLSGYDMETWDDYRKVSAEDLSRIESLIGDIIPRR